MHDAWQILRDGGVPLAAPRRRFATQPGVLADSAREVIEGSMVEREAEALAAWLLAWRDHFPTSFHQCFDCDESSIVAWATGHATNPDRFIKLRRIAIENLSTIL